MACGIEKKKLQLTDSDSGLWGENYKGIEIQTPDSILTHEVDTVVIPVSDKYKKEVAQRLKDRYHITDEKIIFSTNTLMIQGGIYDMGNVFLIDADMCGTEENYDMWYELYKLSMKGMNIGVGGYRI